MQPDVKARFWAKVDTSGECWLWMGARSGLGYGQLRVNYRLIIASRLAYTLLIGPIPDGSCVLHRCDNPPCVRPDHLWLGTKRDNTQDMLAKGRAYRPDAGPVILPHRRARGARNGKYTRPERTPRGERVGTSKLIEEHVREIRRRAAGGETQRSIARSFGVTQAQVSHIVRREQWADLH